MSLSLMTGIYINDVERTKIAKYQYLNFRNNVREAWAARSAKIISLAVGAIGLIKRDLDNYLNRIPGCSERYIGRMRKDFGAKMSQMLLKN